MAQHVTLNALEGDKLAFSALTSKTSVISDLAYQILALLQHAPLTQNQLNAELIRSGFSKDQLESELSIILKDLSAQGYLEIA